MYNTYKEILKKEIKNYNQFIKNYIIKHKIIQHNNIQYTKKLLKKNNNEQYKNFELKIITAYKLYKYNKNFVHIYKIKKSQQNLISRKIKAFGFKIVFLKPDKKTKTYAAAYKNIVINQKIQNANIYYLDINNKYHIYYKKRNYLTIVCYLK